MLLISILSKYITQIFINNNNRIFKWFLYIDQLYNLEIMRAASKGHWNNMVISKNVI